MLYACRDLVETTWRATKPHRAQQVHTCTIRTHEARAHEANSVCEHASNARIYIVFVLLRTYMGYEKNSRQHFSQNGRLRAR